MKFIQIFALASISTLAMSNSCQQEKADDASPCSTSTVVTSESTPSLYPIGFCHLSAPDGESKTYIINSATELAQALQCGIAPSPSIDFASHTLLAGRTPMPYGANVRSQSVVKNCQGEYTYIVNIDTGGIRSATPTDVDYAVLIPKLAEDAKIVFDVRQVQ